MIEVIAYEMKYDKEFVEQPKIDCALFETQYFEQYKRIYNECFYDMRKALEIEPYNFLNSYEQIAEKVKDIYLPITLHVAEWNRDALALYQNVGFEVVSCERVRAGA